MEEWKFYCDGVYISNMGRVVRDTGKRGSFNPHFVNQKDVAGYNRIKINKKYKKIHRIVGKLFIPNPDNKPTIDHIDRTKDFNMITNLRWATMKEQSENKNEYVIKKSYNKLDELCVNITKANTYRLNIKKKRITFNKTYKTIEEARAKRIELIGF